MSPSDLDAVNADLGQFVHTLWLVLGSAAGLGVATMVILQLAKDLFPIRRAWQRQHIEHWLETQSHLALYDEQGQMDRELDERLKGIEDTFSRQQIREKFKEEEFTVLAYAPDAYSARRDLIKLACAGREAALYSLPVEQLAGQTSTAMQFVVDYPAGHEDLLRILATGAPVTDLKTLFESSKLTASAASEKLQEIVDARTRVSHIVQRNLDAFQISIASRWKLYLQIVAIAFSVGLMCFLVWLFPLQRDALKYIQAAVIGILGGFVSSVAWDLFAVLRRQSDRV
jgi:hypothetical protein